MQQTYMVPLLCAVAIRTKSTVAISQKQFSSRGQRIVQPTEAINKNSIDDTEEKLFFPREVMLRRHSLAMSCN